MGMGNNENGELGQNDVVHHSSPVQVGSDTDWDKLLVLHNKNTTMHF